MIFELK